MTENKNIETSVLAEAMGKVEKDKENEMSQMRDEIQDLKDTSIYKVPQSLKDKGYKYDEEALYCPFGTNPPYYLKVARGERAYEYSIGMFDEDIFEVKTLAISDKAPLNVENTGRNKKLGQYVSQDINAYYNEGEKPFGKDSVVNGLKRFGIAIGNLKNSPQLNKDFKKYQTQTKEEEKEALKKEAEDNIEVLGLSFSDYSENIQSEARKLVDQNRIYDNIKKTVSFTHEGDKDLVSSLILVGVSIYIGDPIHSFIGGETGKGKTDLIKTVFKNFPQHHIFEIEEFSPKWIFYNGENLNDDYNILLIDDIDLTNSSIVEILKRLTDNSKKVKKLNTVYEQKALNIELKSKFLVILTNAKGNSDSELSNRLYDINILQDEEKEKSVKEKIKKNILFKSKEDKYIDLLNQYNQCAIQYLNEKEVKVFNPYSNFVNVQFLNNRHISSFFNLIDSHTYLNFTQRKTVRIDSVDYLIGSEEDISEVYGRWDIDLQSTDLNARQQEILNLDLPILTVEEAYAKQEDDYAEFSKNDSQAWREEFKRELWSRDRISRELSCSKDTVKFDLDTSQKDRNTKNLYEMGMIGRYRFEPSKDGEDNPRSMWIYYIPKDNKEGESSNTKNSYWYIGTFEMYQSKCPLESKRTIINNFLSLVQFTIYDSKKKIITSFCKEYDDINSYEDMVNFLNEFISYNLHEFHEMDDDISIEEVLEHMKNVEFFSNLDTMDSVPTSDNEGESSNTQMEKDLLVHSKSTKCTNTKNENEGKSSNIENELPMEKHIECFLEFNQDKTMNELQFSIAEVLGLDVNSTDFEHTNLRIKMAVANMIKEGKIVEITEGFHNVFHLVED